LHGGSWLFDGRLIILKQWTEHIGPERDLLLVVPVWVRFLGLHLKLWSQPILNKIASLIGKPLYTDKATASSECIAYARSFIEIAASTILPKKVSVQLETGEVLQIDVEFE